MNKALEKERGFLPSNTKTTEVLQPGNGALHLPTAAVTTQWACILCDILRPAIAPMGSDHFYLHRRHRFIQGIAIVGFVSNEPLGLCVVIMKSNNSCTERLSYGPAAEVHAATGRPLASTMIMSLTPLTTLRPPIPSPPPLALEKVPSIKHS